MNLIKKVFLISALISAGIPLKADQVFTLSGTNYNLKTIDTTWTDGLTLFTEQPWWVDNDAVLSVSLADLVQTDLGPLTGQTRFGAPFALRENTATQGAVIMYDSTIILGSRIYGLAIGTTYNYVVCADNLNGCNIASDDGDATYTISGTTTAGQSLSTSATTNDPDGNGTISSYTWQSSSDGSNWTTVGTSATYTLTTSEEGKYIRVTVSYTDGESFSESVTASSVTIPHVDSGDAGFSISGSTYAGKILTAAQSSSDPDGDGTFSYQWQSSSDNSIWADISGATNSTFTVTETEEGKYIRLVITYTDSQNFTESVIASAVSISQLHTEWLQPYAAMQNVGLKSIHNNRDLVLAKAGECNNYGWVIGDTDYCVYTNANNIVSNVDGNSVKGSYETTAFNTSLNLEKTINDKWKAGIAYGVGSSNLNNFNLSGNTANLSSTNNHYSIYGVKKVNNKFTLKGMLGGSVFDYKGKRNYSTTSATSGYESEGYTAEINGTWDIKKNIKNSKTPIRLKPSLGVSFAAHTQDGFSESGSGDLVTIDPNQAESLLFKTGIAVDKQMLMEGGKWLLVPSIALDYEMDTYSDANHRSIKGGLTESTTAHTKVEAKSFGKHKGSVKVAADFVLTKDFMFNLNAKYGLATGGDQQSYGGGFRWQF